jgi:hypothetical protein
MIDLPQQAMGGLDRVGQCVWVIRDADCHPGRRGATLIAAAKRFDECDPNVEYV